MLRALPMSRVSLIVLASEAQDVALLLARYGAFGPAEVEDEDAELGELPVESYRDTYLEAAARLEKILAFCGRTEVAPLPEQTVAPNLRELKGINGRLRDIWQGCSGHSEQQQRLAEEKGHLASLRDTLERLRVLDVDLSRLLRQDGLLAARVGQIPAANLKRLADALSLAGHVLTVFDRASDQAYVVVAGPKGDSVGGLLAQAGWRELPIPAELQTHPDAARRYLDDEERRLEVLSGTQSGYQNKLLAEHGDWLRQARLLVVLAKPFADSAQYGLKGRGQLAMFSGWVPRRDLDKLRAAMGQRFGGRYLLRSRDPVAVDRGKVPSLLTYPRWLRSFLPLVQGYGVPRYGEFDPALLFAVTYICLFGAMFGDVGHGAVLVGVALFLKGRLRWLRLVGVSAGLSAIVFGLLYGSVFGYEEWIHPLWQSPLADPGRLLLLAVGAGVGFIAVTLLINIYNRLAEGQVLAALFDSRGLAGLVFYLATVWGLAGLVSSGAFGFGNALTAVAALLAVAIWVWAETHAKTGERLIVCLIETLETATNLFANTLSFLRVAAFSLNHVALALAVFTIANSLDTLGHGISVVLGNIVIIVLEGGIVAIQALRLMYYEGFSRFYAGDGIEFRPLRLQAGDKGA